MGLDMYLRAHVSAPKGSPLYKVIEDGLTEQHRAELAAVEPDYPDYQPYAYVSGWSFGNTAPDELFGAISAELGFTPTRESPSIHVKQVGEGYSVEPTIHYWRKANAIHRWFVERAQNGRDECQATVVHPELLLDLIDRCEEIAVDPTKAERLLPSQSGFFFGETEYDEWYMHNVERTAVELKAIVELTAPRSKHFVYQSSW